MQNAGNTKIVRQILRSCVLQYANFSPIGMGDDKRIKCY